jgi:2-dehydropantoate 2-reductase
MNFLIYGAGALGQALGCLLVNNNHRVTLVTRTRFIESIRECGLSVTGIFGDFHVEAASLELTSAITGSDGSAYDFILLTTKSYDTKASLDDLATLTNCTAPVVSMQNGCGNLEQVEMRFGTERSFGARIITGFEIQCPATVTITVSADDVHIGAGRAVPIPEAAARLAETINQAGLPTIAVEDINQSLFAKLLYNCALNPLGATLGVSYGMLAEHRETREIMDGVIEETFAVIRAVGGRIAWQSADQYKEHFYQNLIPATYNHRPSMLQDLENNKPTEIEAFTGYVSALGRKHAISTPRCDLLSALIRFKQQGSAGLPTEPLR